MSRSIVEEVRSSLLHVEWLTPLSLWFVSMFVLMGILWAISTYISMCLYIQLQNEYLLIWTLSPGSLLLVAFCYCVVLVSCFCKNCS